MRGMGCLLTGIELFPGNIQGGSHTPAGWASGLSIDQEIKNFLQRDPATRTRFGSLEFGVMVPDRADTWTRMVYAAAESADRADRQSVPDVRQALWAAERSAESGQHPGRSSRRPGPRRRRGQRRGSPPARRACRALSARWNRICVPAAKQRLAMPSRNSNRAYATKTTTCRARRACRSI